MSGDDIITAIPRPSGDQDEDLSEYKFQKYAATYFQGNVNHQYSRKQLKQPLLQLQTQGDQLVRRQGFLGGRFLERDFYEYSFPFWCELLEGILFYLQIYKLFL